MESKVYRPLRKLVSTASTSYTWFIINSSALMRDVPLPYPASGPRGVSSSMTYRTLPNGRSSRSCLLLPADSAPLRVALHHAWASFRFIERRILFRNFGLNAGHVNPLADICISGRTVVVTPESLRQQRHERNLRARFVSALEMF